MIRQPRFLAPYMHVTERAAEQVTAFEDAPPPPVDPLPPPYEAPPFPRPQAHIARAAKVARPHVERWAPAFGLLAALKTLGIGG